MNYKNGFPVWDEELDQELFAPEEIAETNFRVAVITAITHARQEQGMSQRELEEKSGVKHSTIARVERGQTQPTVDTLMKLLAPLGMTLAVVPLANTAEG